MDQGQQEVMVEENGDHDVNNWIRLSPLILISLVLWAWSLRRNKLPDQDAQVEGPVDPVVNPLHNRDVSK